LFVQIKKNNQKHFTIDN